MALRASPRVRAPQAVYELIDLLRLAESAIERAQPELRGEALNLARRLASQIHYLRGVSDLLEHEATRPTTSAARGPHGAAEDLALPASPRNSNLLTTA